MQTFLPFECFQLSAQALDMRRLGKQRVEAWQIWLTLSNDSGWRHHPAVRMWRGHESWLMSYGIEICAEWIGRGYRDTILPRFMTVLDGLPDDPYPPWLGRIELHSSHRANLIRKDPVHYGSFGWSESPALGYHWPKGKI